VFWLNHDPTVTNRQFCDSGSQYRPEIFYHSEEQRRLAEESKERWTKQKPFKQPLLTPITQAGPFYPAEDYHQDYLTLHPDQPYIAYNDLPKIAELKRLFPDRYRETPALVRAQRR